MFLINFWLVLVFLIAFWSLKKAKNEREPCVTLGNEFPSQSRDSRKRIRERNPLGSNFACWCEIFTCYAKFKGQKLQGKFGALTGVQLLHDIYHFEAWEVRSLTLQTVCNLELKRGSYGHLKANAQSWGGISYWHFLMRKFSALTSHWLRTNISQCENFHSTLSQCENFRTDFLRCEILLTTCLQCENVISRYFTPTLLDFFTLRYLV